MCLHVCWGMLSFYLLRNSCGVSSWRFAYVLVSESVGLTSVWYRFLTQCYLWSSMIKTVMKALHLGLWIKSIPSLFHVTLSSINAEISSVLASIIIQLFCRQCMTHEVNVSVIPVSSITLSGDLTTADLRAVHSAEISMTGKLQGKIWHIPKDVSGFSKLAPQAV